MMPGLTGNGFGMESTAPECDSSCTSSGPAASSPSVGFESNDAGAGADCGGLDVTAAGHYAGSPQPHNDNPYHGIELCRPDVAVTITAEAELISARQVRHDIFPP